MIDFNKYYPKKLETISNYMKKFYYFDYCVSKIEFEELIQKSKKGISEEELNKLLISSCIFNIDNLDIEEIRIAIDKKINKKILEIFYYTLLYNYEERNDYEERNEKFKEKFYRILSNRSDFLKNELVDFEKSFFDFLMNYRNNNKRFESYLYEQMLRYLENKDYTIYEFCKYQNIKMNSVILKNLLNLYIEKNKKRLKKEVAGKILEIVQ